MIARCKFIKTVFVKDSMWKRKKVSFLFISLPWLLNELLWSINKLKQGLWCTIWLLYIQFIYIKLKNLLKVCKKMGKTKKYTFIKSNISLLFATLSSLRTWKLSTKFYDSYKLLINYQKNSNIKDKIKTNMHFDNTFTVNE